MLKIYGLPNIIRYDQKKLIFRKETRCPWLDAVVYLDSEMEFGVKFAIFLYGVKELHRVQVN